MSTSGVNQYTADKWLCMAVTAGCGLFLGYMLMKVATL